MMPVLTEDEMRSCIGGSGCDFVLGSAENPFTESQMDIMLDSGMWDGGYVKGMGYVAPAAILFGFSGIYQNLSDFVGPDSQSTLDWFAERASGYLTGGLTDFLADRVAEMEDTIQSELLIMGYVGKDELFISKIMGRDFANGGKDRDIMTMEVYNASNGKLINSYTLNVIGIYRKN